MEQTKLFTVHFEKWHVAWVNSNREQPIHDLD